MESPMLENTQLQAQSIPFIDSRRLELGSQPAASAPRMRNAPLRTADGLLPAGGAGLSVPRACGIFGGWSLKPAGAVAADDAAISGASAPLRSALGPYLSTNGAEPEWLEWHCSDGRRPAVLPEDTDGWIMEPMELTWARMQSIHAAAAAGAELLAKAETLATDARAHTPAPTQLPPPLLQRLAPTRLSPLPPLPPLRNFLHAC